MKVDSNGFNTFWVNMPLLFPTTSLSFAKAQTVVAARNVKSTKQTMHNENYENHVIIPFAQSQKKIAIFVLYQKLIN